MPPGKTQGRLGEQLVKAGSINPEQLAKALEVQKQQGGKLGTNLVKLGFLDEPTLVDALSKHFGVPAVALEGIKVEESIVKIIPADVARKYTILPIAKAGPARHHRDDRPDQRLRDGRHQVHDRLQRRAGGGLRDRAARRDRQATTARPTPSSSRR